MDLFFKPFEQEDFEDYKSWFADTVLNRFLGPIDDTWLESVLAQTNGIQYSVLGDAQLVAVLGVKVPDVYHQYYVITDMAVKPAMQGKGLGTRILSELYRLHPLKSNETWRTYVNESNHRALVFFQKNGWVSDLTVPSRDGILSFELT